MKYGLLFLVASVVVVLALSAGSMDILIVKGAELPTPAFDYNDALIPPDIPEGAPDGSPPSYLETSEYLIGDVAVGIIFLESDGSIDTETEDWTTTEESNVINEITVGLNWLAGQNPGAGVSFTFDIQYGVPTSYEPINRAGPAGHGLWISEAMTYLGYPGVSYFTQVRDYINDVRNTLGTDWAYAMFIVDSSNDPDGSFTDGWYAYAYVGGPFLVMTYDNDGYGIGNMDYVTAHETCHIFYATDEYNGVTETSGYLGVQDLEGSGCMMELANTWWLCTNSREQLGWRDSDGDGIQDIVDTFPDTTLNPHSPDPTFETILMYTGSVVEVPYPNNNPRGTGNDVTINTITNVEFRVDGGSWTSATPTDGAFDEDEEDFTFTTPPLSQGTHTIEVRGINSVGNIETTYASDTVTIAISIWSSDFLGDPKDVFLPSETVYVTVPATGQTVTLYVVADQATWNDGDSLTDVSDGVETLTLNPGPGTQTIQIWAPPLVAGNYDIVMDWDNDGVFDAGLDLVDSVLITGFTVIPEVPFGTVMISLSMFIALVGFLGFKRFRPKFRLQ